MRGLIWSIGIHAVLLLGACGVVRSWTEGDGQADLHCSIRSPEPTLDRLEPLGESRPSEFVEVEATLPRPRDREEKGYGPLPNPGWVVLIAEEAECGTCVREIFREYQGRVVVVTRREYRLLMHPEKALAARRESMANNRSGTARLQPP